jgi:hypothetical protein
VSIKRLHKHLPSLLAEIEDAGLTVVAFQVQPDSFTAAFRARLQAIGVENAVQLHWPGRPHIEVQLRLGGPFGADDVTEAIQPEVDDDGNRRKLERSGLEARHLFVWVDVVAGAAQAAFSSLADPTSTPELPVEVTCVWAAPHLVDFDGDQLDSPVWMSTGERWNRYGPDPHSFLMSDPNEQAARDHD